MKTLIIICILLFIGCGNNIVPVGEVVEIPNLRSFKISPYGWCESDIVNLKTCWTVEIRTTNFYTERSGKYLSKTTMEAVTYITNLEQCLAGKGEK